MWFKHHCVLFKLNKSVGTWQNIYSQNKWIILAVLRHKWMNTLMHCETSSRTTVCWQVSISTKSWLAFSLRQRPTVQTHRYLACFQPTGSATYFSSKHLKMSSTRSISHHIFLYMAAKKSLSQLHFRALRHLWSAQTVTRHVREVNVADREKIGTLLWLWCLLKRSLGEKKDFVIDTSQ